MNQFTIDCYTTPQANGTTGKTALIGRLRQLKTTKSVSDFGSYREDRNLSKVVLVTTWNEAQLEDWLYRSRGVFSLGILQTA